jgi:hypothetical protein
MSEVDSNLALNRAPFAEERAALPVHDGSFYLDLPSSVALANQPPSKPKPKGLSALQAAMNPETPDPITEGDWNISEAAQTLTDYILIRVPGRGPDGSVHTFRFLVNPSNVQVTYNTVDSQSLTRSGWNFGVWGDDLVQVNMSGKTAGYYFARGLTEEYRTFSKSYRNIYDFQQLFENNGYWYEGEDVSILGRKRIKVHEDLQLVYQNFIWFGMFESFDVTSTADTPFLDTFKFSYIAWKERYRATSPWRDSLHNDVKRGHTRGIQAQYGKHEPPKSPAPNNPAQTLASSPSVAPTPLAGMLPSPPLTPLVGPNYLQGLIGGTNGK